MTRSPATTIRASGPPNAISKCGNSWKVSKQPWHHPDGQRSRRPASCRKHHKNQYPRRSLTVGDIDYQKLELPYQPHDPGAARRWPVVVIGAGPVGLTLALDMAGRGHDVLIIDDNNHLSTGSRAICFSKRALDIWDRIGVAQRMVDKGVSWHIGKVFFRDEQVWQFDLLPETGHRRPAFINLQQYYCEGYLYDAAAQHPRISMCWKHKAVAVEQADDGVTVTVSTPDGNYQLLCDW